MEFAELFNTAIGDFTLGRILLSAVLLVICLLVMRVLMRLFRRVLDKTKLERQVRTYILTAVKFVLYAIIVLIVADNLGVPITSLVALLSVVSLAISLAVQDILSNVASGFILLTSKPFRVGDYVCSGECEGTVQEMTLTHTILDTPEGQRVTLPNSMISGAKIINYSALPVRRVQHIVSASYDASATQVREAMLKAVRQTEYVKASPEAFVAVESYGESAINYLLRFWVDNERYWDAYWQSLEKIRDAFDEAGIEMTYNHLNVHIVDKKAQE